MSAVTPIALHGRDGTLAALEATPRNGARRGTAVLVPGFTGSKEDFAAMLPLLADSGFRAVAYDQRGQWQSDGPDDETGYTVDAFAADLVALVDQVGDGEPVHLLGHSFGGYVSRVAVVTRPRCFRSLTLLCSGPSTTKDIDFPQPAHVTRLIETGGPAALWELMLTTAGTAGLTAKRLQFLHDRLFATRQANLVGIMRSMEVPIEDTHQLRASGVPILVAYGTEDLWPVDVLARFARDIGARQTVYSGAGHTPNQDRPGAVCADLLRFWAHV
jgi:pimeloyl-ACP methyl ester carboxylesterase